MGYQKAGFYVVGVDNKPQPHYCGDEFHQADALEYPLDGFDVIHASPPCQKYSKARHLHKNNDHPDLIGPTRERLKQWGGFYVIENVPGAPLLNPIKLCGSSFGIRVRRHRLFESNVFLFELECNHKWQNDSPLWSIRQRYGQIKTGICYVFGHQETGQTVEDWKKAMGIDWMTRHELSQAIPPAYTFFIGTQLMEILKPKINVKKTKCGGQFYAGDWCRECAEAERCPL